MATHEVTNQVPPLIDHDVSADPALLEAVTREGAGWAMAEVRALGALAGGAHAVELGRLANSHPPVLRTHDRYGHRIDEVEFHPAWHELMGTAVAHGLHAAPWVDERPGAHVARAAGFYLWGQVDAGHTCPISMTYAAVPALRREPRLAGVYETALATCEYDARSVPPGAKRGLIAGMSMTEKQGGSDVRANTTRALRVGDGEYVLTGHKWFTSAPMSDLFLVLAQAPGGLSCFLLPRVLPDGTRNAMTFQRLKDKLGNRSNASAEVEYDGAVAWLVGAEGDGVRVIIEMVNMTRLDCVLGAASGMRFGTREAHHHATHRSAFGRALVEQPLMRNVLADLVLESEAATTVAMRLAGAVDRSVRTGSAGPDGSVHGDGHAGGDGPDGSEAAFRRLGLAVTKYWVCKRAAAHAAEALECLGGNGYVEDSGMPRLYREAPLVSIWEGSGNIAALDALRAMRRPEVVEAFLGEVALATGADRCFDAALAALPAPAKVNEYDARRLVERMALLLQGSLLIRYSPPAVADAFCASRLGGEWGRAFGTLKSTMDFDGILTRA